MAQAIGATIRYSEQERESVALLNS